MNAIKLLRQDHKTVEGLFKQYERAGDEAFKEKKRLAEQITKELSIHAAIEEELLYPAARELSEKLDDMVLEALEEHHVAKTTLAELEKMQPTDERYDAKMTVLMENIRHHVKEEQEELFPKLERLMTKDKLNALGTAMEQAKKRAPTRPHPMAPDTPPGNLVSDSLAAILDAGKDLVRDTTRSAKGALGKGLRAVQGKSSGGRSKSR